MVKDPVDLARRRPRRLRGTPANRVVTAIGLAGASLFMLIGTWIDYSEAGWAKRFKASLRSKLNTPEEELHKRSVTDDIFGHVVRLAHKNIRMKEAGITTDDIKVQRFIEAPVPRGRFGDYGREEP